jgi:hypothetical protein
MRLEFIGEAVVMNHLLGMRWYGSPNVTGATKFPRLLGGPVTEG